MKVPDGPAGGGISEDWPVLQPRVVHLWHIDLQPPPDVMEEAGRWLDDDERGRAARFRFSLHRGRYIAGRAAMRLIVGKYTGLAPATVRFHYLPAGKPILERHPAMPDVRFNLSHSRDLALLAVTSGHDIGVDVEFVDQEFALESVSRDICTHAEIAAIDASPAGLKANLFFNIWTRKEAYIKALGQGLSIPLGQFGVYPRLGPETECSLRDACVENGYTAAVAVLGDTNSHQHFLLCWQRYSWISGTAGSAV